jgi:hypothetical protein
MTLSESEVELDWPSIDELKQYRDVISAEWDGTTDSSRFTADLAAAITQVKIDVGLWDELTDVPDESLNRAAMRLAVLLRMNAEVPPALLSNDPIYQKCLKGHRRRFAIA